MVDLDKLVEIVKTSTDDYAKELDPDGDWDPMLFVFKGTRFDILEFDMPPNGLQREEFFEHVLPNKIKEVEPDAVIMLTSSWYLEVDRDIPISELPVPSENEDRKEAISIQGVSKDEEIALIGKIIRSDGPPEIEWLSPSTEMEGRAMAALRRGVLG